MRFRIGHDNKPGVNAGGPGCKSAAPCSIAGLLLMAMTLALAITAIGIASADIVPIAKSNQSKPIIVAASASDARAGANGKISLDFVASDIHDVLKALAMQGGVNIVAGPDVKGNITISLSSVTVDEALKLVVSLSGYKYSIVDGIYIVGTPDNMRALQPPVATQEEESISASIAVRYADMASVKALIKSQFPSVQVVGEAVASKSSSSASQQREQTVTSTTELSTISEPMLLVLFGPQGDVLRAKDMVMSIEESMGAIANASIMDIVEINYADIMEVVQLIKQNTPGLQVTIGPNQGFNLVHPNPSMGGTSGLSNSSGSSGGGNSSSSTTSNSNSGSASGASGTVNGNRPLPRMLILKGTQPIIDKAKNLIAKVDVQAPQIMIEAKVLDLNTDASKSLGIDWTWDPFTLGETNRLSTATDGGQVTFGIFHRSPVELQAAVKALATNGSGRILANPNVLALDGKPASIVIGDKIIYVKSVLQGTNGPSIETGEEQVGIQLHTISSISSDGYITMSLHPEVSVITKMVPSNGGFLPQIANRYVDSTVRIKDGETIVLGGLIRDEDIQSMSGIPILKDLPFIGQFFGTKTKTRNHSEVMMFITPRILPRQ